MRKLLIRFWPLFYIIGLWLLFSSPYFLQGNVPYPSKYQVTFFKPWSVYEEYWGPVKNNAMPDIVNQIYPWKHFTIDWLKKGEIPYWNPYNFAGNPHVGNFQSAVYSPFNMLFFVLPFIDAWSLIVLLQPIIAGISTYIFLRTLGVSKAGGVVSSVTYMFCGFMVVWMAYGTLSMAIALLPLALYAIEKTFQSGKKIYPLLLSLCIAISFFSGHFQTSLYLCMFTAAYILFKVYTSNYKRAVWVLLGFIAGLAISLVQLIPTMTLYASAVRSGLLYKGGGIPAQYLPTIFAPDFYGNPVTRNDWYGTYAEWSSFIGIIPLFLVFVVMSMLIPRVSYLFTSQVPKQAQKTLSHDQYVLFFLVLGFISLVLSMDTPLHQLLIASHIPVLATSIPSRMIVLFSFAFAVLAGFGMDTLQHILHQKDLKKIIPAVLAMLIVLLLSTGVLFLGTIEQANKLLALKNLVLPVGLFVALITIVCLNKFILKKYTIAIVLFTVLLFVSIDSLRFATKWMPFDPRELVFPDVPVISAMQQQVGNGRIFGNLGTQAETYYGIGSLEGYDPLYIQRYGEFIRSADDGKYVSAERSVAHLSRTSKYTDRVLDLLGVTHIFHPRADSGQSWAYPIWEKGDKYSLVYEDDKFQLYKNNTVVPRAVLFYSYETFNNEHEVLKRFYSENFDFRKTLLLEKDPELTTLESAQISTGSASIAAYTPNKVVVHATTEHSALLFLSDTYYPKWHVKVNGVEQELLLANYAFRAVVIPSGESQVEFYYKEY